MKSKKRFSNQAMRRYYRESRYQLPFRGKQKKRYQQTVSSMLDMIGEETPDISYEELIKKLGEPKDQIDFYTDGLTPKELSKNFITVGQMRRLCLIATAVLAIVVCLLGFRMYRVKQSHTITVTITTYVGEEHIVPDDDPSNTIDPTKPNVESGCMSEEEIIKNHLR